MDFNSDYFAERAADELKKLKLLGEEKMQDSAQAMRIYEAPQGNASKMLETLKGMGILVEMPPEKLNREILTLDLDDKEKRKLFASIDRERKYLVMYPAQIASANVPEAEKPVTAVICTGSATWFSLYKPMIARLLMNGIDVIAFSYRGHELSEGKPTDQKVFQDLETVCHHLFDNKMISTDQLLLYASCMGLGPAAQYVKNHPETNLFIDRSFSRLSTVAALQIPQMELLPFPAITNPIASRVASLALPYLVNFENLPHLQGATGQIAIVTSEKDDFIKQETEELKAGLPEAHHITSPAKFGHAGNWLRSPKMIGTFESFLTQNRMARDTHI